MFGVPAFQQPEYLNAKGMPVQLHYHSGAQRWVWMCATCKANLLSPHFGITRTDDVTTCAECKAFKPTASAQQAYWEGKKEAALPPEGEDQHRKLPGNSFCSQLRKFPFRCAIRYCE